MSDVGGTFCFPDSGSENKTNLKNPKADVNEFNDVSTASTNLVMVSKATPHLDTSLSLS